MTEIQDNMDLDPIWACQICHLCTFNVVQWYSTGIWVVQTLQQSDYRRLAAATLSDKRHCLQTKRRKKKEGKMLQSPRAWQMSDAKLKKQQMLRMSLGSRTNEKQLLLLCVTLASSLIEPLQELHLVVTLHTHQRNHPQFPSIDARFRLYAKSNNFFVRPPFSPTWKEINSWMY
jgi:hypothetical protein